MWECSPCLRPAYASTKILRMFSSIGCRGVGCLAPSKRGYVNPLSSHTPLLNKSREPPCSHLGAFEARQEAAPKRLEPLEWAVRLHGKRVARQSAIWTIAVRRDKKKERTFNIFRSKTILSPCAQRSLRLLPVHNGREAVGRRLRPDALTGKIPPHL